MALVVENGSGLANAESYCSVAAADAYHSARGNTNWATLSSNEKEQALRRGTDYMGSVFGPRWKGSRVDSTQALDWPRYDVVANGFWVPSDSVPIAVVNACAEMAFRAAGGDLAPDLGTSGAVTEKTVGPITVKYATGTRQTAFYQAVDNMLRAYLGSGGSMMRVARA